MRVFERLKRGREGWKERERDGWKERERERERGREREARSTPAMLACCSELLSYSVPFMEVILSMEGVLAGPQALLLKHGDH